MGTKKASTEETSSDEEEPESNKGGHPKGYTGNLPTNKVND